MNRRAWEGEKRPSSSSKPISAGGGLRLPPALMGFEEEDGRFDPKNRRNPGPILKIRVSGPLGWNKSVQIDRGPSRGPFPGLPGADLG
jgi:hypothetical protein